MVVKSPAPGTSAAGANARIQRAALEQISQARSAGPSTGRAPVAIGSIAPFPVLRSAMASGVQMVAPAVYRPETRAMQPKATAGMHVAGVAPPVYRPNMGLPVQAKIGAGEHRPGTAPAVYRPAVCAPVQRQAAGRDGGSGAGHPLGMAPRVYRPVPVAPLQRKAKGGGWTPDGAPPVYRPAMGLPLQRKLVGGGPVPGAAPPVYRADAGQTVSQGSPNGIPPNAAIQRVICPGTRTNTKEPYKNIEATGWYKDLNDLQKRWAHELHLIPNERFYAKKIKDAIKVKIQSGATPAPLPVKANSKKEVRLKPLVARKTGPATGLRVDLKKHRRFRTERRVLRRMEAAGLSAGDKNLYLKRYKLPGASKGIKLMTSSIPPASLPTELKKRKFAELEESEKKKFSEGRLGQTLHSEGVTDKIEKDYPPAKKGRWSENEVYSASSREQCEVCRYEHRPSRPDEHVFHSYYSGTTDHIEDEELREKLISNHGTISGKAGTVSITEEQRKIVAEARKDAKAARQFDETQNPALTKARKQLKVEDSEDEYSSDDDELFITDDLFWGLPNWPGGPVTVINRGGFFSAHEMDAAEKNLESLMGGNV